MHPFPKMRRKQNERYQSTGDMRDCQSTTVGAASEQNDESRRGLALARVDRARGFGPRGATWETTGPRRRGGCFSRCGSRCSGDAIPRRAPRPKPRRVAGIGCGRGSRTAHSTPHPAHRRSLRPRSHGYDPTDPVMAHGMRPRANPPSSGLERAWPSRSLVTRTRADIATTQRVPGTRSASTDHRLSQTHHPVIPRYRGIRPWWPIGPRAR